MGKSVGQQPSQWSQQQPVQQQPMPHRRTTNPCCCCKLKCGVISIAIVNIVVSCIMILACGVGLHFLGQPYYEYEPSRIGTNRPRSVSDNNNKNHTERLREVVVDADEFTIAVWFILGLFVLDLILNIVLLIGGAKRHVCSLVYWMVITIIILASRLISLYATYWDIVALCVTCIFCVLPIYFLIVVYFYIKEIKANRDNMQTQRQMGTRTPSQQLSVRKSQHGNPNAASTTASTANASGSDTASAV